jgi:hypothetical protein
MTITSAAARRILRRQGMPRQEIRAVFGGTDPLVARRLLQLHRLDEWLHEQEGLVSSVERSLADDRDAVVSVGSD